MILYHLQTVCKSERSTISHMDGPDLPTVYTCEDVVRETPRLQGQSDANWVASWKIHGKTAIPAGTYRLAWTWSKRFQRNTLQLLDVPGFEGIRIHPGNTSADTEGCILPGLSTDRVGVQNSKIALAKVESAICPKLEAGLDCRLQVIRTLSNTKELAP